MELLTLYAFEYVKKQFRLSEKIKILNNVDDNSCAIDAREGQLVTSIDNCTCVLSSSMKLPCRHIMATMSQWFATVPCVDRWKLQYL